VQLVTATGGHQTLQSNRSFVIMTGGGYFFAPSISALSQFLAKP